MKITVVGATGFIGIHLVESLIQEGHEVSALLRKKSKTQKLQQLGVKIEQVDFNKVDSIFTALNTLNPKVLITCAGVIKGLSYKDYHKGNALLTSHIAKATFSLQNPPYFIYLSSAAACGPSPSLTHLKDENSPLTPVSWYGRSKMEAEILIKTNAKNFPYSIIRPVAVYGPTDFAMQSVFNSVKPRVRLCLGSTKNTMDLIHVFDLVNFIKILVNTQPKNETYIIGDGVHHTQGDILQKAFEQYHKKGTRWLLKITVPNFLVLFIGILVSFAGRIRTRAFFFNQDKAREAVQKYWSFNVDKSLRLYKPKEDINKGFADLKAWFDQNLK